MEEESYRQGHQLARTFVTAALESVIEGDPTLSRQVVDLVGGSLSPEVVAWLVRHLAEQCALTLRMWGWMTDRDPRLLWTTLIGFMDQHDFGRPAPSPPGPAD